MEIKLIKEEIHRIECTYYKTIEYDYYKNHTSEEHQNQIKFMIDGMKLFLFFEKDGFEVTLYMLCLWVRQFTTEKGNKAIVLKCLLTGVT